MTLGIIKNISEENTLDSEAVVALFANELKERTVRSIAGTNGPAAGANTNSNESNNNNPNSNSEFRSNRSSINTLPSLMEHSEDDNESNKVESDEINPLHLNASTVTNNKSKPTDSSASPEASAVNPTPSTNKLEIVPPMPNFSSPFTNAIQNATGEVPLDRKTSHNSATSEASETSFHTADSYINPLAFDPEGNKHISNASPASTPSAETAATPPPATPAPAVRETPRLLSFKEGMPEFYVQSALQTLIFDTTTSEGNTRKLFIDRFKSACIATIVNGNARGSLPQGTMMSKTKSIKGATLVEVRHFIDGMHEYILGNRGVSLSLLYEREKQRSIILQATSSASVSPTSEGPSSSEGGASSATSPAGPIASSGGRGISRGNRCVFINCLCLVLSGKSYCLQQTLVIITFY